MTKYTFQKIQWPSSRTGMCPVCGKRSKRTQTFMMTVNPFNKNPDGTVRTPAEVLTAVKAKASQWQPDFTHEKCQIEETEP